MNESAFGIVCAVYAAVKHFRLVQIGCALISVVALPGVDLAEANSPPSSPLWIEFFRTLDTSDPFIRRNQRVILQHLNEGIEIATSSFPNSIRIELMGDWISRTREARNLGIMDPVSLKVRYELSRFEGLLRSPPERLDLSFSEIAQTLKSAKRYVEAE